jgi:uncharacterized membrane protein SirB2
MIHKPEYFNTPSLSIWERMRLVKRFNLSITDSDVPVAERIHQLNAYQSEEQHKYYEAGLVSDSEQTHFSIRQRNIGTADEEITVIGTITIGTITDGPDQSTHVVAKIFPSILNSLFVSGLSLLALFVLVQTINQLQPEHVIFVSIMTVMLVITSLLQWLGVANRRISFDQFLQQWLTNESSIQQAQFDDEPLQNVA